MRRQPKIPSIKKLREICQPITHRELWYAETFIRPISIYITKALLYTPISANQVTILGFLAGIAAGTLFIFGNYWYSLVGAILLQLTVLLDRVDGEVARYRGTSSLRGAYLDNASNYLTTPYIFVGISFGAYGNFHNITWLICGFSASLSFLLIWLLTINKYYLAYKDGSHLPETGILLVLVKQAQQEGRYIANLLEKIHRKIPLPHSSEIFGPAILIGAIFNGLHIVLVIFGIILALDLLVMLCFHLSQGFSE